MRGVSSFSEQTSARFEARDAASLRHADTRHAAYSRSMDMQVRVGGWEHLCCGAAFSVGDTVTWEVFDLDDGAPVETHHVPEEGSRPVTGRVAEIRAVFDDGTTAAVTRAPGGSALNGFDDLDDGHLVAADTGGRLERRATSFRVRLA